MPDQVPSLLQFLESLGLAHLVATFQAEDIDLSVLPLLGASDLADLGLSLGQRKKLMAALKRPEGGDAGHENRIQLRRLSVLFCDMVGSTDLGERLNIDEMQNLLGQYYAIAGRIARQHGGHIATVQGDGVIMLFGFPKAVEGTAAHCVQAALAFQSALDREPARLFGHGAIHIRTRIGVATGKAAVGQADGSVPGGAMHLVGPVVNRAARLQSCAAALSIAVDDRTREQTEAHFAFSQPEMVQLKGLPQDIAV
jgi:class 3 adenylate cyclase